MKRSILVMAVVLAMTLTAAPAIAHGGADTHETSSQSWLKTLWDIQRARIATAQYHSLKRAIDPNRGGFSAFGIPEEVGGSLTDLPGNPSCFDDPKAGGMGVHYVKDIDATVSVTNPEALVYEVGPNGTTKLVGLEYIVPEEFVENAGGEIVNLPTLFGHNFHKHKYLPVYILHAWVWRSNPNGMFADFNPRVRACPN
jgi:hypothetical protein